MISKWIYWQVPDRHVKRDIALLIMIMFVVPNLVFGMYYTILGFLINLIWFDAIFYGYMKIRDEMEGGDR